MAAHVLTEPKRGGSTLTASSKQHETHVFAHDPTAELPHTSLQLPRKLPFFSNSSKVNPLEPSVERCPVEEVARGTKSATSEAFQQNDASSDLPESIVEHIFQLLKADALNLQPKTAVQEKEELRGALVLAHSLSGVCRTWRRAALHVLLSDWWMAGRINHPRQCFFLAPAPFPALLRCFVERSETGQGTRFLLHQGERTNRDASKFLMAAELSRFGVKLHFDRGGSGAPCGRVESNLFCTKYSLSVGNASQSNRKDQCRLLSPSLGGRPAKNASLAEIEYRTRLHACMRPRRLHVTLPGNNVLMENAAGLLTSSGRHLSDAEGAPAHPHAVTHPRLPVDSSLSALVRPRTPLRLENKAPHWNEYLKCWCLNFRGRVKFASVKNFQLVDTVLPSEVVMQFGKVAHDTYILDFQPASISAAQAFSVALSAFNKGFSP